MILIRCDITNWSRFWSHGGILRLVREKLDRHHPTQFYYLHAFSSTPYLSLCEIMIHKNMFLSEPKWDCSAFGAWFNMAFRRNSWETGNKVVTNTIITLEVNLPTIVSPSQFPTETTLLFLGWGPRDSDSVGDSKIMIRLSPNQINAFSKILTRIISGHYQVRFWSWENSLKIMAFRTHPNIQTSLCFSLKSKLWAFFRFDPWSEISGSTLFGHHNLYSCTKYIFDDHDSDERIPGRNLGELKVSPYPEL